MKFNEVTFPDSKVVARKSYGQTNGQSLITDVLAPYSVGSVLSFLINDPASREQ